MRRFPAVWGLGWSAASGRGDHLLDGAGPRERRGGRDSPGCYAAPEMHRRLRRAQQPRGRGSAAPGALPTRGQLQPLRNVCEGRRVRFLVSGRSGGRARPPLPPPRPAPAPAPRPGARDPRGRLPRGSAAGTPARLPPARPWRPPLGLTRAGAARVLGTPSGPGCPRGEAGRAPGPLLCLTSPWQGPLVGPGNTGSARELPQHKGTGRARPCPPPRPGPARSTCSRAAAPRPRPRR